MAKVILVLSPHLDDAVLSCSGYIQRIAPTCQVILVTVFSQADESQAALYRRRRAEDRQAARLLGAKVLHLPFLDAPFRAREYRDFLGIVFGQAHEYRITCRRVAAQLQALAQKYRPVFVLTPLAVGNHVDHRLVRDAALAAFDPVRLLFYEDRPYAFVREQLLHVRGRPMGNRLPAFWRRYFRVTYIRRYLGDVAADEVVRCWAQVPAFPEGPKLRSALRVQMPPEHLERALQAIRAYRSQIDDLFASDTEMEKLYAERPETYYVSFTCK